MKPWWELWPGRLEYELSELEKSGISYEKDEEAQAKGFILLHLRDVAVGDKKLNLDVRFPSHYPFFRFNIYAQELSLKHHQNPFQKNLCLIGSATKNWNPKDYVAAYIKERLPNVLLAGGSDDLSIVEAIEENQAEPLSVYYNYRPDTIVITDSSWSLDPSARGGAIELGILPNINIFNLKGAILKIKDLNGNVLANANQEIERLYGHNKLSGRWIRSDKPILQNDPLKYLNEIIALDNRFKTPKYHSIEDRKIDVTGIVFPEEVSRRQNKDGWLFIVRAGVAKARRVGNKTFPYIEESIYFARPGRAGDSDFKERLPELITLSQKKVALVGLGCLGAPSALELARCGVGELRILDFDFVEAGSTVRWPFGLLVAGGLKTQLVYDFIRAHYPYTNIKQCQLRLGDTDPDFKNADSSNEILDKFLDGVDLIYDTTGELGVMHILSSLAAERSITYMRVTTTPGAWGGLIARIIPGKTEGCWYCMEHALMDESIMPANFDPNGDVQPKGCADPTFTGAGFDTGQIALNGVRVAVSTLTRGCSEKGYPSFDWDVAVINLRDMEGHATLPDWKTYTLKKHALCHC